MHSREQRFESWERQAWQTWSGQGRGPSLPALARLLEARRRAVSARLLLRSGLLNGCGNESRPSDAASGLEQRLFTLFAD